MTSSIFAPTVSHICAISFINETLFARKAFDPYFIICADGKLVSIIGISFLFTLISSGTLSLFLTNGE